jgi:hypothetical protein
MAKAVGEIISGIMTILILNMLLAQLAFAPIEIRESSIMNFVMWLFIFVIIWCFTNAAVNIVAAIRTKKEQLKIAEISRRVEAIEKNIQNLQFSPVAAGFAAGAAAAPIAPPMTGEAAKKASKKTKVAVIAVVAILIVAAIAVALVLFAFSGPATPGAASPEQAFNSVVDYMNSGNAAGVVSKSIWALGSNSSDVVTELNQKIFSQGSIHISIISGPTVFTLQMLNSTEKGEMDARVSSIETAWGVDVTEYSVIAFTMNVTMQQGTKEISERILCVLVDEKWYLDIEDMFGGDGDGGDGDGDGETPPIEISLSVNGPMGGNWTLMVMGVYNTSSLSTNDVFIEVKNSTSAVILSSRSLGSMISGDNYSGVVFNDNSMTNILNNGDEFLLDETIFAPGSEFRLTDSSGSTTYADYFL